VPGARRTILNADPFSVRRMTALKKIAVTVAGVVGAYYIGFGAFYLAGYRLYRIPTDGMRPTIQKGESVIGRLSGDYADHVRRFDLAIIAEPGFPERLVVKRVIGLSGEHITIDRSGVRINGLDLGLPDGVDHVGLGSKPCDVQIPGGNIFVLGDFTSDSLDSRYFGPIAKSSVKGVLVFRK